MTPTFNIPALALALTLALICGCTTAHTAPMQARIDRLANALGNTGSHANRTALYAWMPASMASSRENAVPLMLHIIDEAVRNALQHNNLRYMALPQTTANTLAYQILSQKHGCTHPGADPHPGCIIRANVTTPGAPKTSPDSSPVQALLEEGHYTFTGILDGTHTALTVSADRSTLSESRLYRDISHHLPEWTILHLGSGQVFVNNNRYIPFPYMLNNGQPHFYGYPYSARPTP